MRRRRRRPINSWTATRAEGASSSSSCLAIGNIETSLHGDSVNPLVSHHFISFHSISFRSSAFGSFAFALSHKTIALYLPLYLVYLCLALLFFLLVCFWQFFVRKTLTHLCKICKRYLFFFCFFISHKHKQKRKCKTIAHVASGASAPHFLWTSHSKQTGWDLFSLNRFAKMLSRESARLCRYPLIGFFCVL